MRVAVLTGLLFLCFVSFREYQKLPTPDVVTVRFLDVGQGDGIVITGTQGEVVVIDGGPDRTLLESLGTSMPFFKRSIDLLVLSHPNLDHLAAFPEVIRRYQVSAVMLTGVIFDIARYQEFLALLETEGATLLLADPKKIVTFESGLTFDVVWPVEVLLGRPHPEVNDTSIVLRMSYGEDSVLFTGDMEEGAEKKLIATKQNIQSDTLKIAHHGSKTSSSTGFLLAVSPEIAVISVGEDNTYGHPHPIVIKRLQDLHIPFKSTAKQGTITMQLDGK